MVQNGYKRVQSKMSKTLKRVGLTVRTIMQIVRQLLGLEMLVCHSCGSFDIVQSEKAPEMDWLIKNVRGYKLRGPPSKIQGKLKRGGSKARGNGRSLPNSQQSSSKTAQSSRKTQLSSPN